MKPTMGILASVMIAGLAWAQNPNIIQKTRTAMQTVQNNSTAASNEALGNTTPQPAVKVSAPASVPVKTASPSKVAVVAVSHPIVKKQVKAPAPQKVAVNVKSQPVASKPEAGKTSGEAAASDNDDNTDKKWSASGKRDPFISPVVNHAGGSGCSTGKKCLEIGAINVRGVVHSEGGFIAVVTNSLNKAYFLRENDPVFDGYVVKITGDAVVFQETMQDRLGKTFTREVVKKITTPAV